MRPPFAPDYATASPISRRALALRLKRYTAFELAHALDCAARQSLSKKDQKWFAKLANRLHTCAASLHFRLHTPPDSESVLELTHKRSCHKAAICPICAAYRSRRLKKKYREYLQSVLGAGNVPVFVMVTFTVPNVAIEEIAAQLALLDQAYGKLVRLKRIANVLIGTLMATEITVPFHDGVYEAHSHIHAIWALRAEYFDRDKNLYVSQAELQSLWSRCANAPVDQEYLVRIHRIRTPDGAVDATSVVSALSEVLKYQTKPLDLLQPNPQGQWTADADVVAAIAKATHKRRALRATGFFLKPRKSFRRPAGS